MRSEIQEKIKNLGGAGLKEGSNLQYGRSYHDMPIPGYETIPTHRSGNAGRVELISNNYDLEHGAIKGLDIGCAIGGMSLGISYRYSNVSMVGVDYDPAAIQLANAIANEEEFDCSFSHMSVPSEEFFRVIRNNDFDFVLWLSSWMWINKATGREQAIQALREVSSAIPVMFFDCSEGKDDGMAGEYSLGFGIEETHEVLLESTEYSLIENLGAPPGWRGRSMFRCSK